MTCKSVEQVENRTNKPQAGRGKSRMGNPRWLEGVKLRPSGASRIQLTGLQLRKRGQEPILRLSTGPKRKVVMLTQIMKKNRCWNQTSLACRAKTTVAMLLMLLTATSTSVANNYIFTAGSSASAWLTSGNWSPSGPPGPHDAAQFDTTVPTSSKGAQINFSNPVNNSTDNEAVGAIQVLATRTSASLFIGNGSGSRNGCSPLTVQP